MIHLITQQWWHQERLLFEHSLVRVMVPVYYARMVWLEYGLRYELSVVWGYWKRLIKILSGIDSPYKLPVVWGHWKKLIKISSGIDCYYCINNITCSIQVYYRPFILVALLDILSTIMTHEYFIFHVETHYLCTRILCIPIFYVLCIPCRHIVPV